MALWIRKNQTSKHDDQKNSDNSSLSRKKKDEKKGANAKRLDNLRIPHQSNIVIKSVGTRNEYSFVTKDLSATGAFVVCPDMQKYPFQQVSTILDCIVELTPPGKTEVVKIRFLGKIARIVDTPSTQPNQTQETSVAGFGIRILQISPDQKYILDNYIAQHGTPEIMQNLGSSNFSMSDPEYVDEDIMTETYTKVS